MQLQESYRGGVFVSDDRRLLCWGFFGGILQLSPVFWCGSLVFGLGLFKYSACFSNDASSP